jgi:CRISPR/Cas system-associated exonuclease Cas4 (RecB family)
MRLCGLRAALSIVPGVDHWVLHDPRLWLGTAFHEVMKAARSSAASINAQSTWDAAISRAVHKASEHPLDRRYSAPERWPSYYLVRQRCLSLAAQIPARVPSVQQPQESDRPRAAPRGAERRFESYNGLLAGRPDFYDGRTIVEYKSNLPDPAWVGAALALDSYKRQLRLYAAIIADATGERPATGRIVAASGQTLEIALDPAECDAEAREAVESLIALNEKISAGKQPYELARPGPASCAGCPFKIICQAFWTELREPEMLELPDAAMAGELVSLEDGPDGDIYSAGIRVEQASRNISVEQQLVLRRSIHGTLGAAAVGEPCRVTGFFVRADGRARAELSTVAASAQQLPEMERAV